MANLQGSPEETERLYSHGKQDETSSPSDIKTWGSHEWLFAFSIANRLVVRISCFSVCGLVLSLTNRSEKTTERFQAFDTLTVNRATECLLLHQKSISKSFIILPLRCNIFLLRWIAVQQVKSATEASERYQVTHVIIHLFIIHVILQSWRPVTSWRSQWFCRPIGPCW